MKTICEKLLGVTRDGAFSPYRQTIHLSNAYGENEGWMCIDVSESVDVTFGLDEKCALATAPRLEKYPSSEDEVVAIGVQIRVGAMTTFRFIGQFSLLMTISDISKVVRFDGCASNNGIISSNASFRYKGFCVQVQDLPKLSMVEVLGLRYSIEGMPCHTILDLKHFTNLKRLWLGSAVGENGCTSGSIKHICLPDEVMETLSVLNISSEYVPANISRLRQARAVVISNPLSSWTYVQGDFLPLPAMAEIEIYSQNVNDLTTIRRAILGWGANFVQSDASAPAPATLKTIDQPKVSLFLKIDPIYESEVDELRAELTHLFSSTHCVIVQRI